MLTHLAIGVLRTFKFRYISPQSNSKSTSEGVIMLENFLVKVVRTCGSGWILIKCRLIYGLEGVSASFAEISLARSCQSWDLEAV